MIDGVADVDEVFEAQVTESPPLMKPQIQAQVPAQAWVNSPPQIIPPIAVTGNALNPNWLLLSIKF